MKTFILITALIELIAGVALAFFPQHIPDFKNAGKNIHSMARMYGAAAIALAYYSYLSWASFDGGSIASMWGETMILFHIGVAVASYLAFKSGTLLKPAVTILHAVLGLLTLYFFMSL